MESGVLLLRDLPAEKSQSTFAGLRSSSKPVNALKGELLIPIPGDKLMPRNDGGKPHNYQLTRDVTISLRAEADDIAPLSKREFDLLEAVKPCHTRYSIFLQSSKIDWGLSLRKGSEVFVVVNPEAPQSAWVRSKAVVHWIGEVGDQRGTQFGVEIAEKGFHGQGTTDGTFRGRRYFICQNDCGFFVSLEKLFPDRDGGNLPAVPPPGTRYDGYSQNQSKDQSQQSQPSGPVTRSRANALKPPVDGPRFKAKDRVVVYNNKGTPVHGTVRWVGKHSSKEFQSTYVCGLEMDVPVKKNQFPDAQPDMTHLVKTTNPKNIKLFLLEPFVMSEAEAIAVKQQKKLASTGRSGTGTSVDPEAVAEHFGASAEELIEDELEALRKAHERKKEKEGLPKDLDFDQQVETMKQYERENKEKMRAKVQILRATMPTAHPRGDRPSSSEMSGVSVGHSSSHKLVHSASDASHDRGSSAQTQHPTQYGHQLHATATDHPHDPNHPQPMRQHSIQEEYETIEEVTGQSLQEYSPQSNMSTHYGGHQQPPQQNLQHDQHPAGLQGQHAPGHQDPQLLYKYQGHGGQPAPQHLNGSGQAGHFQRSASSPHHSPQLEAQHEHGRQPHQQSQQKEQDLQMELQQSRQREQDLQRQLAQSQQKEQDLQRQLQLTTKAMQDLQLQSHSQASSRELEFWNVPRSDIRVVSEIGRGGWGTVLKGTFQGRAVAIKQLHPDILSKENIQRLRREVRMMAQIRHPNLLLFIAAVFDDEVERLRTPPLIVMELLDTDLRKAYKTKLILSRDRIPIFRDVAFALNYLHNCHEPIIHRDLSAPNVLLEALANNRWKAKVSDFGSANLAKVAQTAAEGAIIYSAPETLPDELRGPNAPKIPQTPKIDVYSYGVLLCEVITCKQPDQLSQLKAGLKQSWPFMHSLISSCTNYYPDDRPTMNQVLKQLQKLP